MPLVFPVPPLSTTFSHILSLVFASIYVGSGVEVTVTVTSHVYHSLRLRDRYTAHFKVYGSAVKDFNSAAL